MFCALANLSSDNEHFYSSIVLCSSKTQKLRKQRVVFFGKVGTIWLQPVRGNLVFLVLFQVNIHFTIGLLMSLMLECCSNSY